MSMFITYAAVLEHTATENTSAFPDAPQREAAIQQPARSRFLVAAILRRAASLELSAAARLERRPSGRRLVTT